MSGMWIIELQTTWLVMENGLKTQRIWRHQGLWKLVMTLHIPSHKLARCHCPCKMGKQSTWKMYFMFQQEQKNLVSIGQMVEQGLQVTFNPNGCFVEDMKNQGKLIAKGERNGRMRTLDVNMSEVNSMLFTHGKGVGDIGIWHKQVGHVNF